MAGDPRGGGGRGSGPAPEPVNIRRTIFAPLVVRRNERCGGGGGAHRRQVPLPRWQGGFFLGPLGPFGGPVAGPFAVGGGGEQEAVVGGWGEAQHRTQQHQRQHAQQGGLGLRPAVERLVLDLLRLAGGILGIHCKKGRC